MYQFAVWVACMHARWGFKRFQEDSGRGLMLRLWGRGFKLWWLIWTSPWCKPLGSMCACTARGRWARFRPSFRVVGTQLRKSAAKSSKLQSGAITRPTLFSELCTGARCGCLGIRQRSLFAQGGTWQLLASNQCVCVCEQVCAGVCVCVRHLSYKVTTGVES